MASSGVDDQDKYRSYLHGEGEKNTKWRYGAPPNYDVVNKLFEEGRTKIWPPGSLEEKVQNLVKTWEMEIFHKASFDDCKSFDPKKYTFSLNGRKAMTIEEKRKLGGGYNSLLQTSLPEKLRIYNPAEETADSSHKAFTSAFPRGFAVEILHVYSGPPLIVYKFRHWGFMEGPFKDKNQLEKSLNSLGWLLFRYSPRTSSSSSSSSPSYSLSGNCSKIQLDEQEKIVKVEFFFDRGELLGGLTKGASLDRSTEEATSSCPFLVNTG